MEKIIEGKYKKGGRNNGTIPIVKPNIKIQGQGKLSEQDKKERKLPELKVFILRKDKCQVKEKE
jgi:hypothetical protein